MNPRFRLPAAAVLAAFSMAARLSAQDVTVGRPLWVMTTPTPDEMPAIGSFYFSPSFPREMRHTDEIAYATFIKFVSVKNPDQSMTMGGVLATEPHFQKSTEEESGSWTPKLAKNAGVPMDTAVWVPVIFNPESAGKRRPDATPRLLEVAPVFVKSALTGGRREPFLIRVKIDVDANGAVTAVQAESADDNQAMEPIAKAVRQWRFAPARQAGQPIAAELAMPVIVQAPFRMNAENAKPPVAVKQVSANYPLAMRSLRLRGAVTVDLVVEKDGSVSNPTIVNSDNPVFDEPAVKALLQWKFQPAERNGLPVRAHIGETINFRMMDTPSEGDSAYSARVEKGGATAAVVRGALVPVAPYELLRQDIFGKAKVEALVDERGAVVDIKVESASRPEFGYALAAALEGFTFYPAVKDGKPVPSIIEYPYSFTSTAMGATDEYDSIRREKRHPETIYGAAELDAPLRPISRRRAIFPPSLNGKFAEGHALVEFLIDDDGHVRLPRVVQADDPLFGYSGVQAVSAWWFDPPTVRGKPAYIRVQVPFIFKGPKKP